MSSSDALWLNVWGTVAAIGFIIVIIGVIIEGVEHFKKFPRKENARKLQIEKIGWFLVVAGLAMEFLGDHAAKRISDREDARLNKEAGDARETAGNAEREAGQANERAANTESNNLVLQSSVLELKAKQLPRMITWKQETNFIFLTENITKKIPIIVHASLWGDDTYSFSTQIRRLLDDAGFIRDSSPNGIETDADRHIVFGILRTFGKTNETCPVYFVDFTTNKLRHVWSGEKTDGIVRPIVVEPDERKVYPAISWCLTQVGITNEWTGIEQPTPFEKSTIEIYIPPKTF